MNSVINSYRAGPDERGRFGIFGGRFVAETLMPLILDLEAAYDQARADPAFQAELDNWLEHYVGRPSPLYFAGRLTRHLGGAKIYFKRDELNHTGAHKINNCMGQILLAKRAVRPALRRLYGRGRYRTPKAECLSHAALGRRSGAGHRRLAHAERRHERSAA
jgi:tryptophan synthase beta chain